MCSRPKVSKLNVKIQKTCVLYQLRSDLGLKKRQRIVRHPVFVFPLNRKHGVGMQVHIK